MILIIFILAVLGGTICRLDFEILTMAIQIDFNAL